MRTQAESVVQKVKDLAALPQVVHQIIHLTNNPNASVKDLERLISIDQGMSTRVLNTVNSAYYGFSRKIASIKDAVVLLGFKAVRNLAMTVSVFDLFVGKTDRQNLRRGKWWRHSIDTALCARLIASQARAFRPTRRTRQGCCTTSASRFWIATATRLTSRWKTSSRRVCLNSRRSVRCMAATTRRSGAP
jgi:HD-like signal output (HDOD) protein